MQVHCAHDGLVSISDLQPHPKNRNKHPAEQIDRLAAILRYQGFRYPIKVSRRSGLITSGHGRLEAARKNGWTKVPVSFQDYESDEQEYADLTADNAIASWSELDLSGINADLADLGPDLDLDMLGLRNFVLEPADKLDADSEMDEDAYTKKIKAPTYTPTGEKPATNELFDLSKTMELMKEIGDEKDLPEDVRVFLQFAAHRHIVFNYAKVAEYYAHAPAKIQELMENSALVIIDFNKAIEKGFVRLSKEIAEAYLDDEQSES